MRLRGERRHGERGRRDAEAGDEIDLVVDDQFLRDALGVVGHRAVVLEDDLDLLAGDGVAVLLHVELDGVVDLLAGRGLAAGHRQDQADLDGVLGLRRADAAAPAMTAAPAASDSNVLRTNMNASPLFGLCLNRVPGPCLTITQIIRRVARDMASFARPCQSDDWRSSAQADVPIAATERPQVG